MNLKKAAVYSKVYILTGVHLQFCKKSYASFLLRTGSIINDWYQKHPNAKYCKYQNINNIRREIVHKESFWWNGINGIK